MSRSPHRTAREYYQAFVDAIAPDCGLSVGFTMGTWWLYVPTTERGVRGLAVGRSHVCRNIQILIDSLSDDDGGDDDDPPLRV